MQYAAVVIYTGIAWLVHVSLVALYLPHFTSSKTLGFRLIHIIEIFAVMFVVFTIHSKQINDKPSTIPIILLSLGTLAAIDTILFIVAHSLRTRFDWIHIVAAFCSVTAAVAISVRYSN